MCVCNQPVLREHRDKQIPGAHWPVSVLETGKLRFRDSLKTKVEDGRGRHLASLSGGYRHSSCTHMGIIHTQRGEGICDFGLCF